MMVTSSDQWLERLHVLVRELEAVPSSSDQAKKLQRLLEHWRGRRAALDQDFIVQISFFLGKLSGQVKDTNITALIQEIMLSRKTGRAALPPRRRSVPTTPVAADDSKKTDEEYIDFAGPDEARAPVGNRRPPAPPPLRTSEPSSPSPAQTPVRDAGEEAAGKETEAQEAGPVYPEVERRVNTAYRLHLNRKHDEIEKLQELLEQKAIEALSQNKEFGALLQTERAALEQASSIEEINELKQILIGSADELLVGQQGMEEKLRSSFEYLQVAKNDSERLHNELTKVRQLSMTDENTGLPNRRAFLRRLDDEIQRARQYNIPLTLALIDLDLFKEINDRYGHPAGDAVLNWYAQNGLSIFRHHDMIARYGGEEFAVLFPGTTAAGASRAMANLRRHVAGRSVDYDGRPIGLPTFSAGLATFRKEEDEASLIKRADQALYRAKSQGRDRTELEQRMPPAEGATGREP